MAATNAILKKNKFDLSLNQKFQKFIHIHRFKFFLL